MPVTKTAEYVNQLFSINGDGTGDMNMNKDYSSSEGVYTVMPGEGETLFPNRFLIQIQDTGAFDVEKYGNGVELDAGIRITAGTVPPGTDPTLGVERTTLTPHPVHNNGDWGLYCFDIQVHTFGTGDEMLLARWTLGKAVPPGFPEIYGRTAHWPRPMPYGSAIQIRLNDDLRGLVNHRVLMQGMKIIRTET